MNRGIQSVIFDLDGTLVNAYGAVHESINFTLNKMGHKSIGPHRIKRAVGWGDSKLVRKLVGEEQFPKAIKIYRKHHAKALEHGVRFLPGSKTLLRFLKKEKYRLAIASNRPSKFTKIILKKLDLSRVFDHVLCGDQVERAKPHPDILHGVLEKFSLKPHQALYVGDMVIDVEAGNAAKVMTVAVTTGSSSYDELNALKPHKVIPRISLVRNVLNSFERK